MTWVKVCGITDIPGLRAAVDGGADAVGFVLAPGSPRTIEASAARDLMDGVDVLRFIVTVDLTPADALAMLETTGADGVQNHGRHATAVAAEATEAGFLSLHPVAVGRGNEQSVIDEISSQAMPLFDTASDTQHGGTGTAFDWSAFTDPGRPFVLAGGLGPENVTDAIRALHPFGVDASSGLESAPGVKDAGRVVDFIERAKQA